MADDKSTEDVAAAVTRHEVLDPHAGPSISFTWETDGESTTLRFTESVVIGRDSGCQIRFSNPELDAQHVQIYPEAGGWWIRDLDSRIGVFLNGERINHIPISGACRITLGPGGPGLDLAPALADTPESSSMSADTPDVSEASGTRGVTDIIHRYFGDKGPSDASPQTALFRLAVKQVLTAMALRYKLALATVAALLLAAVGFAVYQHFELENSRRFASGLFYDMKALELEIVALQGRMLESGNFGQLSALAQRRSRFDEIQSNYEELTEQSGLSTPGRGRDAVLIAKVLRIFGECDIVVPDDFNVAIGRRIEQWLSSGELDTAMRRLREEGLAVVVPGELERGGVPPQYLYIALRESTLNRQAIGVRTHRGLPKGLWQIPTDLADELGLSVGIRADDPVYESGDERFDAVRATQAVAKFLRETYASEASGSGLLAIAAYNWAHRDLVESLRKLPSHPKERNFWRLRRDGVITDSAYRYVIDVVAAAVVAEDPAHFGFTFPRPSSRGRAEARDAKKQRMASGRTRYHA